jgi:hypothetical protein
MMPAGKFFPSPGHTGEKGREKFFSGGIMKKLRRGDSRFNGLPLCEIGDVCPFPHAGC